jgi:hypothetical protein
MSQQNGSNASTEALREEIRQTRADLGETVQALAAKADVKSRLKESAAQTSDRFKESAAQTSDRFKESAAQTSQRLKESASQRAEKLKESAAHATDQARVSLYEARDLAQRSPLPWFGIAGAAAVLAVILVVRGRRR